jgi:hypothetical protein
MVSGNGRGYRAHGTYIWWINSPPNSVFRVLYIVLVSKTYGLWDKLFWAHEYLPRVTNMH